MADPTQYTFSLSEVATALVKAQGLHEGRWALGFEFNFNIGVIGSSGTEAKPGVVLLINRINMARQTETIPGAIHIVDAAEVNPLVPAESPKPTEAR